MVSIISCPQAGTSSAGNHTSSPVSLSKDSGLVIGDCATSSNCSSANNTMTNSLTQRLASLNFGDRKDKRNSSGRSGSASTSGLGAVTSSSKNSSQTSLSLQTGGSGANNGY